MINVNDRIYARTLALKRKEIELCSVVRCDCEISGNILDA